ncbi:hypothetical protein [Modestobacter marinus]|uniref:hypothetical protein n=1 Tax=Modestobacter marinus TaxID=477641 RepID=UPI001C964880|nr:hypothetical protein [Modestobacter marinus]
MIPDPAGHDDGPATCGRARRYDVETIERTTWVCVNCTRANASVRKRCEDCGTTRD